MSSATLNARSQEAANTQAQELGSDVRRRTIEDKVLLLSPTVGRWDGSLKIPAALVDMKIDGKQVVQGQKGITTPRTVMMNDEWPVAPDGEPWKKKFAKISKIKDHILQKYSVPFEMAGARIVPKHKGVDFFAAMIGLTLGKLRIDLKRAREAEAWDAITALEARIAEVIRNNRQASDITPIFDPSLTEAEQSFAYQWNKTADEFAADLHDRSDTNSSQKRGDSGVLLAHGVLHQIRDNLKPREAWNAVEARVPKTAEEMRAKFYTSVYPVELATGAQFGGVTADLLADYQAVTQQAVQAAIDGCITQVIERPREELCQAMASLKELIARDGNVTQKSFKPVYAAMEKLRLFSFACTPEMLEQLDSLQGRLERTVPGSLSSINAANNGFMAALDTVIADVENADSAARDFEEFGKETRGITF